jgi:hypothetical protein
MNGRKLIEYFGASTTRIEKRNVPEWKESRERIEANSEKAMYAVKRYEQRLSK